MTEITLKEIPVQILSLESEDVIVLRVPPQWDDEMRYYVFASLNEALVKAGRNNQICVIGNDVGMAVVRNILAAHQK